MYTIEISTENQYINETDYAKLIITFTVDLTATNKYWSAVEKGIKVADWGVLEWSYDIEDALLVPGTYELLLTDKDGVLDELFFGHTAEALACSKAAKVEIQINGMTEYIGIVQEDGILYDKGNLTVKLNLDPKIDVINKRKLFDDENNPYNPFGYNSNYYYSIITILEDIFQLVNPNISYSSGKLEIYHDWNFEGKQDHSPAVKMPDIHFMELLQLINPLYFSNSKGLDTCGDVLRKMALDWCSFTGMVHNERAFFKKLFHYDSTNLQTLGTVYQHHKYYKYGLIDYVKVITDISRTLKYTKGTDTQLEDRFLSRDALPGFYDGKASPDVAATNIIAASVSRPNHFGFNCNPASPTPAVGSIYSHNGSTFRVKWYWLTVSNYIVLTMERVSGVNNPTSTGTLTRVSGVGADSLSFTQSGSCDGDYHIYQVSDPNLLNGSFVDNGELIAEFWYNHRGFLENCRVDFFSVKGVGYDFLKDFNYGGSKYQPISLRKFISESRSEFEALYLGEL